MANKQKEIITQWWKTATKSGICLLFMLILGGCMEKTTIKNDLKVSGIKGKVESIEESCLDEEGKVWYIEEFFLNEKGNMHSDKMYGINDAGNRYLLYATDYQYNENDERTKVVTRDAEGEEVYKIVYQYKKNEIEQIWYENNEFYAKHIKKYDEKGNVIAVFSYKKDKQLQTRGDCKYNENNIPISEIWYDENDKIVRKVSFKHDEKGKITESYESQSDTLIVKTIFTQHDEKGNWRQSEIYKNNKLKEIRKRRIVYYNNK